MDYKVKAENFVNSAPYRDQPYNKRNWGQRWHSLCSYHGKLKPSIAYWLIKTFTNEGDVVLDPLCGVGTIPLEASLQNRFGIGNDLSELAYYVTKAKVDLPKQVDVDKVIVNLEKYIKKNMARYNNQLPYSDFGLNKKLTCYYEENTFKEILLARDYFLSKKNVDSAQSLVIASILHILHGNRPYALSRNSHPLTPYAPTGDFIYKSLIEHTRAKTRLMYNNLPEFHQKGQAIFGDFKDLNNILADIIITSPPFADSFKFYTQNWIRLWFCGWEDEDFKKANIKFLDNQQNSNFDIYLDFFEKCSMLLKPKGKMILHLGKSVNTNMSAELELRSQKYFDTVFIGDEDVTHLEKHGLKDKGGTIQHQFMFLIRKE